MIHCAPRMLCAALLLATASAAAQQPRYLAVMVDGRRVEGDRLVGWHESAAAPSLRGVRLHDAKRPMLWLRDRSIALGDLGASPTGWVEFVGGDRLPGRVTGAAFAATDGSGLPAYLLVAPSVAVHLPDDEPVEHVRILSSFVQRVVWSATSRRSLQPGTLFYRDGARLAFRSLRWNDDSLLLLVDGGTRRVSLADVAEVHLPRRDPWETYYQELAMLSPACRARLTRIETGDGLILTGSERRFRAVAYGAKHDRVTAARQLDRLDVQIRQDQERQAELQDRLHKAQAAHKKQTAESRRLRQAAEKTSRDAIRATQRQVDKQGRDAEARWDKQREQLVKQHRDAEAAKVKQLANVPKDQRDKLLREFRQAQTKLRTQREQQIERNRLRMAQQRRLQIERFRRLEEIKIRKAERQYSKDIAALQRAVDGIQREWRTLLEQSTIRKQRRSIANDRRGGPDTWYHMFQPAWSLDPLWTPFRSIGMRWSFAPNELPLARIYPAAVSHQASVGTQASWRINRSLDGRALRSGGQSPGWGFAVQGSHQLAFDLPEEATSFRSRLGLDHRAGDGGCVRVRLFADSTQGKPLYESPFIVGSGNTLDTGAIALRGTKGRVRRLILLVDDAHAGRPSGADPLDIRDLFDWLDPLLVLDEAKLRSQVRRRAAAAVFAWRSWSLEDSAGASADDLVVWGSLFDESRAARRARFLPTVRAQRLPLVLSRESSLGPDDEYLIVDVSTTDNKAPPAGAVRLRVGDVEVPPRPLPPRRSWQTRPAPLVFLLAPHQGKKVELKLTQAALAEALCWRSIDTAAQLPPMYQLDDALKAAGQTDLEAPESLGRILESNRVSRREKVAAIQVFLAGGELNFTNPSLGRVEADRLDCVLIGTTWKGGDKSLSLVKQLGSLRRLMVARDAGISEAAVKEVEAALPDLQVQYFEHTPSPYGNGSIMISVRNLGEKTVVLHWVNWQGRLQQFNTLPAGEEIKRHSYLGHRWEAHVEGKRVDAFVVNDKSAWEIKPPAAK